MKPLPPHHTIGLVGGGQLGRMLALAAARLGFKTHIFCDEADAPALQVATAHSHAAYDDETALAQFAAQVDVITYEFENIPTATMHILAAHTPVFPPLKALEIAQDRLLEKNFVRAQGIDTADFHAIDTADDIPPALADLGGQAILKTRRFGYDGKGQWRLDANNNDTPAMTSPAILEAVIPFEKEISVAIARGNDGATALYAPIENTHENHILRQSVFPAAISPALAAEAHHIASVLAEALDYVGILVIELFVVGNRLLVNEIAPRVHNSSHLTEDACICGQFEQHIRAIAGWSLGNPAAHSAAIMTNIIGDEINDWQISAREANTRLHLYGKSEIRAGRKMGHITRLIDL